MSNFPNSNEVIDIEPSPTPVVSPIIALLKSRKTITAIVALVLNVLVAAVPEVAPMREELMTVITGLALGLIGTIAWEDSAKVGREAAIETEGVDTPTLVKGITVDLIDTILTNAEGQTVITLKPNVIVE